MYHKILVPLDGSERAEKILPHVESLALSYRSEVTLLRVVQTVILDDGFKNILYQESMDATEEEIKESDDYLTAVSEKIKKPGFEIQTMTKLGTVQKTILDTAEDLDVDLIAMASHGRSGIGRVFYGSVTAGIIQHIDRPLLVIRSQEK